jgi:ferredoxin-NADP reductase
VAFLQQSPYIPVTTKKNKTMAPIKHTVKILAIEEVTHNVRRIVTEKPNGYEFKPGQATEVSINKPGWKDEARPFTFTSLEENPCLEFTIKVYDDHDGVTKQVGQLKRGDELIIRDVWGAIRYEGPGFFIAGGAGVTPFIAIIRMLESQDRLNGNKLLFSNKTGDDIILEGEFTRILGDDFINTLTEQQAEGYDHRFMDKQYLREKIHDFSKHFYVCGPPKMVEDIQQHLSELGAESSSIVFEQ